MNGPPDASAAAAHADDSATVTATAPPGGSATAISTGAVAITKTVEHEAASDLPESNWLWRRVFIFALSIGLLALIWRLTERITDITTLRMVARYALLLVGLTEMLYVAGASAESITRLIGAVRTTRKETVSTAPADGATA